MLILGSFNQISVSYHSSACVPIEAIIFHPTPTPLKETGFFQVKLNLPLFIYKNVL